MDAEKLLDHIDQLEDKVFSLSGLLNALVFALDDAGINFRESLRKYTARAANELEEDFRWPEAAKFLDTQRAFLLEQLQQRELRRAGTLK